MKLFRLIVCVISFIEYLTRIDFLFSYRTLTYCVWNLMTGEDQSEMRTEKVALPPPAKRRDHHLRKFTLIQ